MNAGDLNRLVNVLEFREAHKNTFVWVVQNRLWAKIEHQTVRGIFASKAVMARTVKITIRPDRGLTLHHALAGVTGEKEHYFLTDINRDTKDIYVLSAVIVEPVQCAVHRTTTTKGANNQPQIQKHAPITFPGYLAEKWLRQTQEEPMSYSEARFVLVTPKSITIDVGELVEICGKQYAVVIPHMLDPYRNEFEVLGRGDN
jgi:hypothetical protein